MSGCPFRLAVINDEITQDFEKACSIAAKDFGLSWIELRGMWNKNITELNAKEVDEALAGTEAFTSRLFGIVRAGAAKGAALDVIYAEAMEKMRPEFGHWVIFEHCMPFNVSRAFDEANGHDRPRIWTAERDIEMWKALEAKAAH